MKLKLLFIFLFGIFNYFSAKAYEVPTETQKKNILLEVFTGIYCGNCPDGDVVTDDLLTAQGNCVYAIDIHSNYYANPIGNDPDFRTEEGELIDEELGANNYGYPGGSVNRTAFPEFEYSPYVFGRSNWIKKSKSINQQDAPVNLYIQSQYDAATRNLEITVEGYYTDDVNLSENYLNVALIQDNIKGPQNGANEGNNYNHRHVLRGYVTPMWGDVIESPQKGEYFVRQYTYTLPTSIRDIEVQEEEIELIAFVCADRKDVLNVTGGKPEYINYNKPLSAAVLPPKPAMSSRYGFNFFNIRLKNESSEVITTASFQIIINEEVQDFTWNGNIRPFHIEPIQINLSPYTIINNQNNYTIQLTSLNSEDISGNSISGSFLAPLATTPNINIEIKTDLYADENIFSIKDQDGNIVKIFGPYPSGISEVYKETADLEPNSVYCFEVIDLWGDGLGTVPEPRGYYKLYNDNQSLILQAFEVKKHGDRVFINTSIQSSSILSQNNPNINIFTNPNEKTLELQFFNNTIGKSEIAIYSITGICVYRQSFELLNSNHCVTIPTHSIPNGIYILSFRQGNNEIKQKIGIWNRK